MDPIATISDALFTRLCDDLGLVPDADGDRFNPFPRGLPPGIGLDELTRRQLLSSCFKKTEIEECQTAEADTLADFLTANKACGELTRDSLIDVDDPAVGYSISQARVVLYEWFDNPFTAISMASIERAAQFGPGRSIGLGEQPSLLYFKIGDCKLTAGSDFIRSWYESGVSQNPLCEAAEMARKAKWGDILVEDEGNLSFVPKSYAKKRIVVTEPSLSTFFQKGLGDEMARVLQCYTGINLTDQPDINRSLAELGSVGYDEGHGAFCTMDLTQCSDYISLALAEYMFPASLVRWMKILRTKRVKLPKVDGVTERRVVDLQMLSTMGNGFTFPMQTVLLASLILGVYHTLGIQTYGIHGRNWGVFGDDIIVCEEAYHLLAKVLAKLGLKVNRDKSFWTGGFRESCGSDFFEGTNVRGVYLKRYSTIQDLFSCFNRLSLWSAKHNIPLDTTLVELLRLINLKGRINLVPPDEQVTAGIMVPFPFEEPDESDDLWHYEAWIPKLNSFCIEPWEYFETDYNPDRGLPEFSRKRLTRWIGDLNRYCQGAINAPALFKACLAGTLRRNKLVMRTVELRYRKIELTTPRWGFSTSEEVPRMGTPMFERWASVVYLALLAQNIEA